MRSLIRIPVLDAQAVQIHLSPAPRQGSFPPGWRVDDLLSTGDGWWQIDLASLALSDGAYEYEFVVERNGHFERVADPYAEEITRFSGYRGVLHMRQGARVRPQFSWDHELPRGLPNNNELVIYELPMRWVDPGDDGYNRQIGLGTFDRATFEWLQQRLVPSGVNCIELLPVQDSADTLNWGYGTRFFFAPDFDMGQPFDLKLFVKRCHQQGIRVLMDLVINHARKCPLSKLAFDWFFLEDGSEEPDPNGDGRPSWGGDVFRYREQRGGAYHARNFHFDVAEFLIREYHVDGFRLDEFKGIDNYDFVQDFTDHAHRVSQDAFPGQPFLVIAEDSWRRSGITGNNHRGGRVVDSMWDFNFRDDVRRLASNTLWTKLGEPSRSARTRRLLSAHHAGFGDLAHRVAYCTSHDIEADDEQRLFDYFLDKLAGGERDGRLEPGLSRLALEQVHSALALTLTAAGIPMFLAGEEFADLHDTDRRNWRHKMSDPVDWTRADFPGHRELLSRVRELVELRTTHSALQRNEVEFFGFGGANRGFHPSFDENNGERLFAFCRAGGHPLGHSNQVIVVANCRDQQYPEVLVDWPWGYRPALREHGGHGQPLPYIEHGRAKLALDRFQVRVFSL
ncbi:MAG: hypothetical protein HY000_26625 [Planctomycetes bacterium]|nr:hypothetical protein [Planctomycetota bacterium]